MSDKQEVGVATVRLPGRPAPPPLALYVHFPWCVSKCPYCDFNSHEAPQQLPESDYLAALRADLETAAPTAMGRTVNSVYLGGGTPSLMTPDGVERLLSDIRMLVRLAPEAEVTMEANPDSADAGRFREYAQAGIDRLSLGVQSLDDCFLRALGRAHDAAAACIAAELAVATFARVNLDLMTALPGQDTQMARQDASKICGFGAEHISVYRLTLEHGTSFYRSPPAGMPGHDAGADCEDAAREVVTRHGYLRYEISAYAKQGAQSRHNLNYWRFGDYLGIGAGAHAKLTGQQGVFREVRHKAPGRYMQQARVGSPVAQRSAVATRELPFEFMLNALRLVDGFDEVLFAQRTGLPFGKIERQVERAVKQGWLERSCGRIRPTQAGLDFQNDLCALFLASADVEKGSPKSHDNVRQTAKQT